VAAFKMSVLASDLWAS